MKKTKPMRTEYRREDLGPGVRGKHFGEFQKGSNLVVVSPELSKIFPTDEFTCCRCPLGGWGRGATHRPR